MCKLLDHKPESVKGTVQISITHTRNLCGSREYKTREKYYSLMVLVLQAKIVWTSK